MHNKKNIIIYNDKKIYYNLSKKRNYTICTIKRIKKIL